MGLIVTESTTWIALQGKKGVDNPSPPPPPPLHERAHSSNTLPHITAWTGQNVRTKAEGLWSQSLLLKFKPCSHFNTPSQYYNSKKCIQWGTWSQWLETTLHKLVDLFSEERETVNNALKINTWSQRYVIFSNSSSCHGCSRSQSLSQPAATRAPLHNPGLTNKTYMYSPCTPEFRFELTFSWSGSTWSVHDKYRSLAFGQPAL